MALKALFYPDVKFDTLFIPHIYKEIYLEGIYIDILNERSKMLIVDVGANIGIVTQYMRDYASKVYAIEPSSEHFEALKKNKEFNGWDNVEVFNFAIGGKDGEVEMHKNDSNRTCNSYVLDYKGETQKVKSVAMDTFLNENKIESVDFMKFDVEGAEDDILRSEGFRKVCERIKAIEVEFHFPNWQDLVNYMISLGYTARRYDSSAIVVLFCR